MAAHGFVRTAMHSERKQSICQMKIRIYQVNLGRDAAGSAFSGLSSLERRGRGKNVDSSIYDFIWEGTLATDDLEDVYEIFNGDRPEDYEGRTMSVSDIVGIESTEEGAPAEYYYCDSIGFKKVEFDPSLAGPEDGGGRIRVLRVEPGKAPEVREIERGLESLQHEVDGYIECVYPFEDPVALVVNEEGKLDGLELNRALRDETGGVCDIIAGSFLVVGLTDEDFCSLDDEMIKKYSEMFASPEIFLHIGGRLHVFPAPDADSAG